MQWVLGADGIQIPTGGAIIERDAILLKTIQFEYIEDPQQTTGIIYSRIKGGQIIRRRRRGGCKTPAVETWVQCGWLNRMLDVRLVLGRFPCSALNVPVTGNQSSSSCTRDTHRTGGHRTTDHNRTDSAPEWRDRNHGEMIYAPIIIEWFILLRISTHGDRLDSD